MGFESLVCIAVLDLLVFGGPQLQMGGLQKSDCYQMATIGSSSTIEFGPFLLSSICTPHIKVFMNQGPLIGVFYGSWIICDWAHYLQNWMEDLSGYYMFLAWEFSYFSRWELRSDHEITTIVSMRAHIFSHPLHIKNQVTSN